MKKNQTESVRAFFDRIAADYPNRYGEQSPFLRFFHTQRIDAALQDIDLGGKKVWDIGAGTAILRLFLDKHYNEVDYYASDISPQMQRTSGLPADRYFTGEAAAAPAYFSDFDAAFFGFVHP